MAGEGMALLDNRDVILAKKKRGDYEKLAIELT